MTTEPSAPQPSRHLVLFLAANPIDTTQLGLDEEAEAIRTELGVQAAGRFDFRVVKNAAPPELLRQLSDLKPTIVHFACHGRDPGKRPEPTEHAYRDISAAESTPGLYLHGSDNRGQFVSAKTLRRTFAVAGASVKLVVFNACYSKPIARELQRHVDCVVGMNGAIRDDAARRFAAELYRYLARGDSVEAAVRAGKVAIELLGVPGRELPKLRARKGVAADELVLRPDPAAKRRLREIAARFRLGVYLAGVPGTALAIAMLVVTGLAIYRAWLSLGDSTLDVRTQWLAVEAAASPEAVQGNDEVRAITAARATIDRASFPTNASDISRRISLTGTFNAIELGSADRECHWIFDARDDGLAVKRVTPSERDCVQNIAVRAGAGGLALRIDDDPPISVAPRTRLVVHTPPGEPVMLAPRRTQIVLFRPANDVVWPVAGLRAAAAAGERIRLPGALRSSDIFELSGSIELRELMFENGGLTIGGSLRHWSGTIGGRDDWNSTAPWPRARYCWALLLLAPAAVGLRARIRGRRNNWGRESG